MINAMSHPASQLKIQPTGQPASQPTSHKPAGPPANQTVSQPANYQRACHASRPKSKQKPASQLSFSLSS